MTGLLSRPNSFSAFTSEPDLLADLLADKRSLNTRRAYEKDLKTFFQSVAGIDPTPILVREFLTLPRFEAIALVLKYKAHLIGKGLKEATVNRRLAAIKSLVRYAQKIGRCEWSLEEVGSEKIQKYRDTTGVDKETFKTILDGCDRTSTKGKRDYAILHLLWSNGLRRGEIEKTKIADFDPDAHTLAILGKGRGTQAERVSLSIPTTSAILQWLRERSGYSESDPLFIALDRNHHGHPLTGDAIYDVVKNAAARAGVKKLMSPHRCRHSAITAALDETGGDVRRVQKLSRHKRIETLMLYDDNRRDSQGEVSSILSELLE